MESQKIVQLRAENIKRLKAIEVNPDGSVVVVGGRNGQGKSSLLDSIMYALAGKGALPARPVRDGEDKGKVVVELTDMIVTRTVTAGGGGTLTVTSKDGMKAGSPQTLLNKLTSQLTFDPLAFTRLSAAQQVDQVRQLVGIDFTELDRKREQLYTERTDVGRDGKRLKGQVESMLAHESVPAEEESIGDLVAELQAAQKEQDEYRRKEAEAHTLGLDIATVEEQLVELQEKLERMRNRECQLFAELAEEKPQADTAALQRRIAGAEETNAKVRANKARAQAAEDLKKTEGKYDYLTGQIEGVDDQKRAQVEAAEWPVQGLSFDEEQGLLVNGLPFSQASSAEQLRVSVAMGLAMNPTLKVLLVRDGSLLDADSMAVMHQLAEEHGAQIWIERVGDGEECAVVIEDGQVAGATHTEEVAA